MSRILLVLLYLAVSACVPPQPLPVRHESPVRVIETGGMDRDRVFRLSRTWLERHLYSSRTIIEYADPASGTIVANSDQDYPALPDEEMQRIQYTVSLRIVAKITAGRVTLHYDSEAVNVPKYYSWRAERWLGREYFGGYSRPPVSMAEYAALDRAFESVVAGLARYLHGEGQ